MDDRSRSLPMADTPALMVASPLPDLPPPDYLATFNNNLLHYFASDIEGEGTQTRVTSRVRAQQAARIIATFERELKRAQVDLAVANYKVANGIEIIVMLRARIAELEGESVTKSITTPSNSEGKDSGK